MNLHASIVVPTYNERNNLPVLLARLNGAMQEEYEVIIVDDDSPDGTWKKAQELTGTYPLKVIRRRGKRDLSTAVLDGVKKAEYSIIVVMDADLQHPPEEVPRLIEKIKAGTDLAIGSRCVRGGSFSHDFGIIRRILSLGADLLAHLFIKETRSVQDTQSGFFAFKKSVIGNASLHPVGFKILLELLVKGNYDRIDEVGYTFVERKAGESKLGAKDFLDYLRHLLRLMKSQ